MGGASGMAWDWARTERVGEPGTFCQVALGPRAAVDSSTQLVSATGQSSCQSGGLGRDNSSAGHAAQRPRTIHAVLVDGVVPVSYPPK
jgi:hypothetical protein